jgi:uncharacterized protein YijF (DUF1287 family)
MQNTSLQLAVVGVVMGALLTACSGNTVVQETTKPAVSVTQTKKQIVTRNTIKKPTISRTIKKMQPALKVHQHRAKKRSTYRKPIVKKRHVVRRITPRASSRSRQRNQYANASFARSLSNAAVARTRSRVRYDGKYVNISYPWGDVPSNIGVCTDVVIRSYRRLGIDLQKEVHEDMANGGFYDYPNVKKWGLSKPDRNIDHRRVYNLQAFFRRHGAQLPITHNPTHYKPGDLVTWMVGPHLPHIGVVVEQRSTVDPRRHMIVHNIANGPQMEDILFRFRITGHYRYNKNNRLIAPRRFTSNKYTARNNKALGNIDYQRLMRELSAQPRRSRQVKKRPQRQRSNSNVNLAQLNSRSGISDADIRAVLGR